MSTVHLAVGCLASGLSGVVNPGESYICIYIYILIDNAFCVYLTKAVHSACVWKCKLGVILNIYLSWMLFKYDLWGGVGLPIKLL